MRQSQPCFDSPFLPRWNKNEWLHDWENRRGRWFKAGIFIEKKRGKKMKEENNSRFISNNFKMYTLNAHAYISLKRAFILAGQLFHIRVFPSPPGPRKARSTIHFPVSSWTSSSKYLSQCLLYLSEYGLWVIPHEKILEMVKIYVRA